MIHELLQHQTDRMMAAYRAYLDELANLTKIHDAIKSDPAAWAEHLKRFPDDWACLCDIHTKL